MKLLYYPGACSLASHIALEEAGATFEAVKVNLREGEQRSPHYLKVNPKGKVPALELDDGSVVTENAAILIHIADSHPTAGLLPAVGDRLRTRAVEWLVWCASSVHPAFGMIFGASKMFQDPGIQTGVADKGRELAQRHLDLLDRELQGKPYVLGDRFSVADTYTPVLWHWAKRLEMLPGPGHRASVERLLTRPGVQRALAREDLKLQL